MPRKSHSHKINLGKLYDDLTQEQIDTIDSTLRDEGDRLPFQNQNERDRLMDEVQLALMDVDVILNTRMGSYGSADLSNKQIEIAAWLKGDQKQWEDTLMHEVAHFIAYWLWKDSGHGKPWKRIAKALGATPDRFGPSTPTQVQQELSVVYECVHCGKRQHQSRRWSKPRYHTPCLTLFGMGEFILIAHPNLERIKAEQGRKT